MMAGIFVVGVSRQYSVRVLQVRIMVGMYSVWLKRWLEVFPRDQILILRNEDYSADTATHLVQVFRFLELGEYNYSLLLS